MPQTQYATAAEYRARTGATDSVVDDLLNEEILAASRIIDQDLRLMPGYFSPHDATYYFQTEGGRKLHLRDEAGYAYALRSVVADGIRPDFDRDGTYTQYQWDFDDSWLWPIPRNGPAIDMPYTAIEIRYIGTDLPAAYWPFSQGSVEIEGSWGWEVTPAPIRELTVHVARDMRDSLRGGAGARVEVVDDSIAYRDDTWRLWQLVKSRYGRRTITTLRRR